MNQLRFAHASLLIIIITLYQHVNSDEGHDRTIPKWGCPNETDLTPTRSCLAGGKHNAVASKEGSTYAQCLEYKDSSCCTAEFTQQLNQSTVEFIRDGNDIFNWSHCGALSKKCEAFHIEIECFYRCDPNGIYFAGAWPGSLDRVPICKDYCNSWFDACKTDTTCATDWISDWDTEVNAYGGNTYVCQNTSYCTTFEERFSNGEGLCNVLWGNTFNFTEDEDCLIPHDIDNNNEVVMEIFEGCSDDESGANMVQYYAAFLVFVILTNL